MVVVENYHFIEGEMILRKRSVLVDLSIRRKTKLYSNIFKMKVLTLGLI